MKTKQRFPPLSKLPGFLSFSRWKSVVAWISENSLRSQDVAGQVNGIVWSQFRMVFHCWGKSEFYCYFSRIIHASITLILIIVPKKGKEISDVTICWLFLFSLIHISGKPNGSGLSYIWGHSSGFVMVDHLGSKSGNAHAHITSTLVQGRTETSD